MEPKEITALVEEAVGRALTPEIVENLLPPEILEQLKAVKKTEVAVGDQMHPAQEKALEGISFSQYLGDVRRVCGKQAPEFIDKAGLIQAPMVAETKALNTGTNSAGGYLVPTEESRQLIDLTDTFAAIKPLCNQVPMRTKSITWPTLTDGLTAYWIPEPTATPTTLPDGTSQSSGEKIESSPTFGQFSLTNHVLAVKVVVNNQLLDDSDPAVDAILRSLFAETLAQYFDIACLRGAGTATDPITGLVNLITTNALAAGPNFDFDDVLDLISAVYDNAPNAARVDIIGHRKVKPVLKKLKDNNGAYIWAMPRENLNEARSFPTIWGEPFITDNNVLTNLGDGGDETRLFAGDFAGSAYVGVRMDMVVKTNPWAEPYFSYNQTAFLAEMRIGFNVTDESRFAVLAGVPTS